MCITLPVRACVPAELCQHCRSAPVSRPRRLCWCCYYCPGVRDLYPVTSKYALNRRLGSGQGNGGYRLPELPTDAAPGSEAKIRVLEERIARREALWHPADLTI
jgi:hypothetical protein